MDEVNKFRGEIVGERGLAGREEVCTEGEYCTLPTKNTTGKIEAMALYAGESVGEVQRVQPKGEIVRDIVEEAKNISFQISE